jgi:hypothetical protein
MDGGSLGLHGSHLPLCSQTVKGAAKAPSHAAGVAHKLVTSATTLVAVDVTGLAELGISAMGGKQTFLQKMGSALRHFRHAR